jgi:hypothetical protein
MSTLVIERWRIGYISVWGYYQKTTQKILIMFFEMNQLPERNG